MKSKEEILKQKLDELSMDNGSFPAFKHWDKECLEYIFEAMEEYANQFKQPEKKSIEERRNEFHFNLTCHAELNKISLEFFEYWTEISQNGKKMRFEKEKVFDIKKRLERWIRNQKTFNNGKSGNQTRFEQHSEGFNKIFNPVRNS